MSTRPAVSTGVPCLRVADVEAAAAHYRNALGFELVAMIGGAQPGFAIMRKHGAALLLQQAAGERQPAGPGGPPWDAVLLVDDVEAAYGELKSRGVRALGDIDGKGIGWDSFDFPDGHGNLLCIGQSADEFLAVIQPAARGRVSRWRLALDRRVAERQERALLRQFRDFHAGLGDRRDVFYMFFTTGLLHWAAKAASFVPADVNLVLLGSDLTADERTWIAGNIPRPFHHIDLPVDDVTAWELLFATCEENFGWLDIDCFVLNAGIFAELAKIGDGTSVSCTWSWEAAYGFRVANTHLAFLSVAAIRAVERSGAAASPGVFDWRGAQRRFPPRKCFMKVPSARQRELLLQVLPADPEGRPRLLEGDYFNTLVVYQLLARAVGYSTAQVRSLARRCRMPVDADSTDPEHWPEDMSDELFHLYGVSYYRTHEYDPGIRALYLAAEYVMLENAAHLLPEAYAAQREEIAGELTGTGLDPAAARERMRRHLMAGRGLSQAAADLVLAPLPPALVPTGGPS